MNPHLARLAHLTQQPSRRVLGLMSGTSLDGLDLALCRCYGHGTKLRVQLERFATFPYSNSFRQRLRDISQPTVSLEELTILNAEIARRHVATVLAALEEWEVFPDEVDLLASHGQTVWHSPRHQRPGHPYAHHATLQLGDGDHLAALSSIITVADFRQKHVAHGREGAPLAGYADKLLFAQPGENRLLLNLGGIANFTFLPADGGPTLVTDTGPANTLLDAVTRQYFPGRSYDDNGNLAAQGTPHPALLTALLAHPFFTAPLPKTTGPELFHLAYLQAAQLATHTTSLPPTDLLATLVELTAASVALAARRCLPEGPAQVYVSGGGSHNMTLFQALERNLPEAQFATIDTLGIPADAKEAVLFAVLANETVAGQPEFSLGKICLP
ncbi:anhydro-N-acetylmuramic acid kinase [Hymenobacter sp. ASUV-10]|uniref:Anhydro-N-acetylmuramic acid kinase n=1 Tax=Hymenobacter aranciens TaxID=3063996 RepID=A0ABT9BCG8_9BACT|nr:anhydro-N-acetylmuramic acid kinase [Hymenobacter sp. ASUV-10]MDO7875394.1 anhydro-N-acetylmuramic acid kinase [Hymenobacter sp. ASUV-10]